MNYMFWDILFAVLFVTGVSAFLYAKRRKLKREGLLFLYHTSFGLKLIDHVGKKYHKTLKIASHVSVWLGYVLMGIMVWMFGRIVWIYAFHSDVVKAIKMPPIMPLIPYLPQMFKLDFLPPFYFSYWIVILAIIAITHEFFHGIFAATNNVKTKTTGFGFFPFFFPVFLAAFVNLDEKKMEKIKNFKQRAVLSAGTFANSLTAIIGILLMWGFFALTFSPVGITYDDHAYNIVNITDIDTINGVPIDWTHSNFSEIEDLGKLNKIAIGDLTYSAVKGYTPYPGKIALYYEAPAITSNLTNIITTIDGKTINTLNGLTETLSEYSPGEVVTIGSYDKYEDKFFEVNVTLAENPIDSEKAWLGISFTDKTPANFVGKVTQLTTAYKTPNVYYHPNFGAAKFIYDLLWWLVLISFSVALVNMLPMGIFDGGRFFYLTVKKITGSEKAGEKAYAWMTNLLLLMVAVVMVFWAINLF